jgi:hypothetical protein
LLEQLPKLPGGPFEHNIRLCLAQQWVPFHRAKV